MVNMHKLDSLVVVSIVLRQPGVETVLGLVHVEQLLADSWHEVPEGRSLVKLRKSHLESQNKPINYHIMKVLLNPQAYDNQICTRLRLCPILC